jgi:hypothetical protein
MTSVLLQAMSTERTRREVPRGFILAYPED